MREKSLVAVVVCALLCFGMPAQTVRGAGSNTAQEERYILHGDGQDLILDGEGNIVMQGKGLSILYDTLDRPAYIAQQRTPYEPNAELTFTDVQSRLFDLSGNQLSDWQMHFYHMVVGEYIYYRDSDAYDAPGFSRPRLGNPITGQERWSSYWLKRRDTGSDYYYYSESYSEEKVLYSSDGIEIVIPEHLYGRNAPLLTGGYWICQEAVTDSNPEAMQDFPNSTEPIAAGYNWIYDMGSYFGLVSAEKNDFTSRVIDVLSVPDGSIVAALSCPIRESIPFAYGNSYVVQRFDSESENNIYTIYTFDGKNEWGPFEELTPVQAMDGSTVYAAHSSDTLYMIDPGSAILWTRESSTRFSNLAQIAPGLFLDKESSLILGLDLQPIIDMDAFLVSFFYPEGAGHPPVLLFYDMESSLRTMVDAQGRILARNLADVTVQGRCITARQGFSQGLMDGQGNWVYVQSIFQTLED